MQRAGLLYVALEPLVNEQVSALSLQLSIDQGNLSELAEVLSCNSLWNSCLNITAPKVNTG